MSRVRGSWNAAISGKTNQLLRPVTQLYGQVRTDWNQCFGIDCSLSHPAGHKLFTCSHSVLRNTWLNIHAVRSMRFSARLSLHVFTISWNLTWSLFISSAVSELSSAWSINCLPRYFCCYIVVKDKSLSVLMVDRCWRFASLKPVQNSRQKKCTVSPLNSPACFMCLTAASLSNAFIIA